MGILGWLGVGKRTSDLLSSGTGLTSQWQSGELHQIVLSDIIGVDVLAKLPLDRSMAITIPAVSKARNLLVSTIAKFPLRCLDTKGLVTNQPSFMYRTDSNVTPYERMAWTVDDLVFYGYSLWKVRRGAKSENAKYGPILSAEYVPMRDWEITNGNIQIDEQDVDELDVILFNSPFEGLLTIGNRTLRGAIDQEEAWTGRARNPIPLIELHVTEEGALTDKEIQALVAAWSAARRNVNGAIGYTPASMSIETHGEVAADLMVEGRNAVRTDVGSFLNIRASMLDGTMGIDSLTYSTSAGEKNSFYEFDLPFWTDPIQARLSMDDVVPRGQRIRFDKYDEYNIPDPTGTPVED